MDIESKLQEIDNKIDRLQQIQDYTVVQTTFLGILFGLSIFSVTALITDVQPIFKIASFVVLSYLILPLIDVFISIFSNKWETKLDYLNKVISWIYVVSISLIVLILIFSISLLFTKTFKDNNYIFVTWILIAFVIASTSYIKYINPRYRRRFGELYKMIPPEKPMKGILSYLDRVIEKRFGKIVFSIVGGLILTMGTGYFQSTPYGETTYRSFGLPFSWLRYPIGANISTFDYPIFVLDMLIIAIIIFIIITSYEYFIIRRKKPTVSNVR